MTLLSYSAWSTPTPQKSRVLTIRVRDSAQADLVVLEKMATREGMKCTGTITLNQGRHAQPPLLGRQCTLAGVLGFFEASASSAPDKLLIQIYLNTESPPHGEVDPAIDKIIERYEKKLVQDRHVDNIEECFAPALAPCFTATAP
jgi:hypothetical protein